ncbi:Trypsin V-A [Frankliniella fusca]|uniref:Trypsin V-A n=1 Tax=Frankliniella fusca TaxID=407009 RepID=A0AAE1LPP1_9NEOP|nr:Trypsin V-A [Frankliniella fusca]
MIRQYKQWCIDNSIPNDQIASEPQYRQIFNYEFNIGFFKPKKDRCQLCTLMKTGTRAERERYKTTWVDHYNGKKACYIEQRKARTLLTKREDVAMLSFDLQKVLPCPKSETSPFFYKNKLSVYNLTVFDSAPALGTCYIWHAGIAKRGANEVGSAVMNAYINCAKDGKKEILSFSDSCSGQNKNRFIYAMMLNVSAKYSIKIRHCFLTPGHTYNDADGVHARIEAATRMKDIYDLKEWIQHIQQAKETNPMYVVKRMKRTDVFNLKDLVTKQNWESDREGNKVEWNKVKIVEAGYDGDGILGFYYKIGGEKQYLDTKKRRGHPVNLKTYEPNIAYPENIPLKALTIKHLQELCKSLAIPSKYHNFYNDIFANIDPTEDEEDDVMDPTVDADSFDPDEVLDENGNLENQMAEEGEEQDEEAVDGDLLGDGDEYFEDNE